MNIIEVPIYNAEGAVQFTAMIAPEEAQHLLQFAINFKMAMAAAAQVAINIPASEDEENYPMPQEGFDD